jgi:hypothetical protein
MRKQKSPRNQRGRRGAWQAFFLRFLLIQFHKNAKSMTEEEKLFA